MLEELAVPIGLRSAYLTALIILIAFLILAKLTFLIFNHVLLRFTGRTKTEIDDKIIHALRSPIYYSVIAIGVLVAVGYAGLTGRPSYYFGNVVKSVLIIIWAIAAARIVDILVQDMGKRLAARTKSKIDDQLLPLIDNLSRLVVIFVAFLIVLDIWHINISPLLASAGIASFAVAFAAKDTISNFFGGISIFLDRPYKLGDYILLDTGERGQIVDIGVRSTRIKTRDDVLITIPNAAMASAKITNESAPYKKVRVRIKVGVAYGSDIDEVEKTMLAIAEANEHIAKEPEPRVRFREFGDSALLFELLCWIDDPELKGRVIHELNKAIYNTFKEKEIKIPFPQVDVHLQK
jgi:small-conductance mechanosensitive channel